MTATYDSSDRLTHLVLDAGYVDNGLKDYQYGGSGAYKNLPTHYTSNGHFGLKWDVGLQWDVREDDEFLPTLSSTHTDGSSVTVNTWGATMSATYLFYVTRVMKSSVHWEMATHEFSYDDDE